MRSAVLGGLIAALTLGGAAACADPTTPDTGRFNVVTGFYPLQFAVERIGGPEVAVTNLAQPGAEPHDLELKPSQLIQIAEADLVLYLKGFQPELDEAIAQNAGDSALDVVAVTPLIKDDSEDLDPHFWLDPTRFATLTDAIADRLGQADPGHASEYSARAEELRNELVRLDSDFAAGLHTCQRREIFTSHAAFGYLAARYNLDQIGLTGLTPDTEPTPQRLAEVAAQAKQHGATTIFFETLVSPRVAQALAGEVGAKTAVLDPLEGLSADGAGDYFSVMRANLAALRAALGCS